MHQVTIIHLFLSLKAISDRIIRRDPFSLGLWFIDLPSIQKVVSFFLALSMVSFRSKEDDVARISISIYVTNFPESLSAKELFHVCKQYGHVVDSFIPVKRSKEGKRFGFVRFINVFNVDRLVGNISTIWVNRFKLQANIARFQREPLNKKVTEKKNDETSRGTFMNSFKDNGGHVGTKSFVNVVKSNDKAGSGENFDVPGIVLDDECLNTKDLSNTLLGRVKEFASLSNLKTVLTNEGFMDIRIRYMGELWVMMEFDSFMSKDLFRDNVGVNSWFSEIKQADIEFIPNGRIVWVELEGIPFKFWSGNTFKKVADKWGELLDVDDKDESCLHSKRLCIYTKSHMNIFDDFKLIFRGKVYWVRAKEENKSEDPFGIYSLLNNKEKVINAGSSNNDQSLKYPPGFTPNSEEGVGSGKK
ncbi:hypothetical protein CTI12_AA520810 [Artemisia annua]|uniref:RRM domain-containing protein n=1 Tax=Artemisia annua TaxID=35608 RepID=A0A2U1L7X1_ARTAN|nr:hypothetical protein CTI12_AA520810 [Artemisia annua]